MRKDTKLLLLLHLFGIFLLGGFGGLLFMASGLYGIAANSPHLLFVRKILLVTKNQSIKFHARNMIVPDLNREDLIRRGFQLYRKNCVACHGAPGEGRSSMGIGLTPNPPPLEKASQEWKLREIAWVIANGLKMAGMPAFGGSDNAEEVWAMTAFVVRMNSLSPREYRSMVEVVEGKASEDSLSWTAPDDGWHELKRRGNAERGRKHLKEYGCTSCHIIPGVPGPEAMTGPPLHAWAERHYLAGHFVNRPRHLIPWLRSPTTMLPRTLMPDLGVTEDHAWDIARYLYSLEMGRE